MSKRDIPKAKEISSLQELHGDVRDDVYAWMRDLNWERVLSDPSLLREDIREYLDTENAYGESVMAPTLPLVDRIKAEMRGRIEEETSSAPLPDAEWQYYVRHVSGGEHPLFCRMRLHDTDAQEEILLDGNTEAAGAQHFAIGAFTHSPDHRLALYTIDWNGSEQYRLYIKDIATGSVLESCVSDVSDVVWGNDSQTVYYVRVDSQHRPQEVFRHELGSPGEADELVYRPREEGFYVALGKTESNAFIIILTDDHDSSERHLLPADGSARVPFLVAPRRIGVRYAVHHHPDGWVYLLTNAEGAEDFQIMRARIVGADVGKWEPYIVHRSGVFIERVELFKSYLVRVEVTQALPRIVIRNLLGEEHVIAFQEEAYSLDIVSGFEFDTSVLRFTYSSPSTPRRVFDYRMDTRERTLVKETVIPSGHDPKAYIVKRITAKSKDGTLVPVTLLYRGDAVKHFPAPCLLYGYGAYGITMTASFSANHLSLVDRGFVFAVAHIRGGMENGFHWYAEGKMQQKKHTFMDFIAVAETLVSEGYTSHPQLAIDGRSAGGMLIGAVLNMRPELFGAAVAGVPFVDVLNTMSDATLPLTPMEWREWGNPIESREAYEYMKSYSPYDNVVAQQYPPLYVTAGLTDPRVTYWEPAKWVAKIRKHHLGTEPVILRTEMEHGHQGSTGRFQSLEDDARIFAFIIAALAGELHAERLG